MKQTNEGIIKELEMNLNFMVAGIQDMLRIQYNMRCILKELTKAKNKRKPQLKKKK